MNKIFAKYANNKSLYIIIIIGIVFMLLSGGERRQKTVAEAHRYDAYSDEERLGNILEKVSGAGKVSVMITYYGTTSYDVAFEKKRSSSVSEEQKNENSENSAVTAGGDPLITGELYPRVKGAVIISEGAGNAAVKKALSDAASAALEVASFRVCVLEGKERN